MNGVNEFNGQNKQLEWMDRINGWMDGIDGRYKWMEWIDGMEQME